MANHAGLRARLRRVLEGLPVTAVITLATFLGMFMDDCRLAFLGPTNDVSCQIISFGILVRHTAVSLARGSCDASRSAGWL